MTLKLGSMSHNPCQIFASCRLCKSVQDFYINIEIVLTLLGVKTIATYANNNLDVEACFRKLLTIKHDNNVDFQANQM